MPELTKEQRATLQEYIAEIESALNDPRLCYKRMISAAQADAQKVVEQDQRIKDLENQLENARAARNLYALRCDGALKQISESQERERIYEASIQYCEAAFKRNKSRMWVLRILRERLAEARSVQAAEANHA